MSGHGHGQGSPSGRPSIKRRTTKGSQVFEERHPEKKTTLTRKPRGSQVLADGIHLDEDDADIAGRSASLGSMSRRVSRSVGTRSYASGDIGSAPRQSVVANLTNSYIPLATTVADDPGETEADVTPSGRHSHWNEKTSLRTSLLGEIPAEFQEEEDYDSPRSGRNCFFQCQMCCRNVVESCFMVFLIVLVTIFALVSTDIRDLYTNRPCDKYFDYAIIFSMAVFLVEFILSCFGKEDYVCGFFFMLDIISTVSMALDVTYIAYYIEDGGDNSLSTARAGRTARLGARAARMVRVIRLFRLVKIYKAVIAQSSKPQANEVEDNQAVLTKSQTVEDAAMWEKAGIAYSDMLNHYHMDNLEELDEMSHESRVGAKLSEMTTRRVITVVMMLLLGLPSFQMDRSQLSPSSTQFGADVVWRAFQAMKSSQGTREEYDFAILNYMFYHNWFTSPTHCQDGKECSGKFFSHLFWVGVEGNDTSAVFQQSKLAAMTPASVDAFQKQFADQNDLYNYGTMPMEVMARLGENWNTNCDDRIWSRLGMSLLQHEIEGDNDYVVECPQDLRPHERMAFHPVMITAEAYRYYHFVFYFDVRPYTRMEGILSLGECVFVCIMFCFASAVLNHDVTTLVLIPIERMIQLMKLIRNDPRMASQMASDEIQNELIDQTIDSQLERRTLGRLLRCMQKMLSCEICGSHSKQSPLETVILEKTIMRLASMLTLGLGEAGLQIIGHSLSASASSGAIDVFALPSSSVDCVMAVVRTLDFNCAIEVLQENVVRFVSHIVEIVHGVIHEYHGAPNRNYGDSMLLIWRTFDDDNEQQIKRLCEMALLSCAKIYVAVNKSPKLMEFAQHPGFQQRLGSNYRVELSFGLHMGWAIEGAVGSEAKIDATYFSPHVNITFAVESATNLYKVPLLATGSVVEAFSDGMYDKCRLIDRVLIRGSVEPLNLYCLDLDASALHAEPHQGPLPVQWNVRTRFLVRQWMEMQRNAVIEDDMPILFFFQDDTDIDKLREKYTDAFIHTFSNAYQCYKLGEWGAAATKLRETLTMLDDPEDGPSRALLDYMQEPHRFQAPKSWNGVRKLDLSIAAPPPRNPRAERASLFRQSMRNFN